MEMKFIHLRAYQAKNSNPYLLPKGGATIGYTVEENGESDKVLYVLAKCSPKDHFCKRIGRSIVEGRIDIGEFQTLEIPKGLPRFELRKILAEKYYKEESQFTPDVATRIW